MAGRERLDGLSRPPADPIPIKEGPVSHPTDGHVPTLAALPPIDLGAHADAPKRQVSEADWLRLVEGVALAPAAAAWARLRSVMRSDDHLFLRYALTPPDRKDRS